MWVKGFIDLIHLFDSSVRFFCLIQRFDSSIWFSDLIHRFDSAIWFFDLIHRFDSSIWFIDLIHLFDLSIWFIDLIHLWLIYRFICISFPNFSWFRFIFAGSGVFVWRVFGRVPESKTEKRDETFDRSDQEENRGEIGHRGVFYTTFILSYRTRNYFLDSSMQIVCVLNVKCS